MSLLAWSCVVVAPGSRAAVIVDDAVINVASVTPHFDQFILKSLSFEAPQLYSYIETLSATQYRFSYVTFAGNYALYPVDPGTTIDPAFAASAPRLVSPDLNPNSSTLDLALGESKYIAYWDERTFQDSATPNAGDIYGWAVITNTPSGLVVSSSATAWGDGIVAGTTTQVPEPDAAVVAGLGAAMALGVRRRSRRAVA
jgi:hypothetical protein